VRNVMRVSMLLNTGKCSSKREIRSEFEIRFSKYTSKDFTRRDWVNIPRLRLTKVHPANR
jgi:hypothetical protein